MSAYIITFIISCICIKIACSTKDRKLFLMMSAVGILLPCVLAGIRADTIGTDVRVYVKPMFEAATNSSGLSDYFEQSWYSSWRYKSPSDYEMGFSILVFVITKLTGSLPFLLFIIQLLIIFPLYKGLLYFRDDIPVWLGLIVFFLLDYNVSLNMMRQWICMAFLFYGLRYLIENNTKAYFITAIVALLFHTAAIMAIVIYAIYKYTVVDPGRTYRTYKVGSIYIDGSINKAFVVLGIGIVALFGLNGVVSVTKMLGLGNYLNYISGNVYLVKSQLLVRLPIMLLFLLSYGRISQNDTKAPFWLSMLFLDMVSSQLTSISVYSFRIGVLFSEYAVIYIPMIVTSYPRKGGMRSLMLLITLGYLVFYWWYYFVLSGTHATVPYISIFS